MVPVIRLFATVDGSVPRPSQNPLEQERYVFDDTRNADIAWLTDALPLLPADLSRPSLIDSQGSIYRRSRARTLVVERYLDVARQAPFCGVRERLELSLNDILHDIDLNVALSQ